MIRFSGERTERHHMKHLLVGVALLAAIAGIAATAPTSAGAGEISVGKVAPPPPPVKH